MPFLRRDQHVFILDLGIEGERDTENRFHPEWLIAVNALLDEALATEGPAALVTTASGKFYSNGADVAWVVEHPGRLDWYLTETQQLLARLLTFPMPTVAALNGHTYGAGAFLAVAHDHRIMRADRGYFCFPGIALGAPYSPGGVALVRSRLAPGIAHEAFVTGRRYGGPDALARGLVDEIAADDQVLSTAVTYAESLAHTRGAVLGQIKHELHRSAVDALTEPVHGYNDHAVTRRS